MGKYFISVNQLAEFSSATVSSKKRILKQQKTPNKLLIPWYQKAKGAIKKFFTDINNYAPIDEAIKQLIARNPINDRQKIDKTVSIQALEIIKKIKLPNILSYMDYELITTDSKNLSVNEVDIIVAPEIIIKAKRNGSIYYGAIKIHISKGKPFNYNQASYVSTLVYQHLLNKIALEGEEVLPELCLCLDVFSESLVPAPAGITQKLGEIKIVCSEVKALWG